MVEGMRRNWTKGATSNVTVVASFTVLTCCLFNRSEDRHGVARVTLSDKVKHGVSKDAHDSREELDEG